MGKTALATNMAFTPQQRPSCEKSVPVAFFLEMSAEQLGTRILRSVPGLTQNKYGEIECETLTVW